jgi:hypothetical protein
MWSNINIEQLPCWYYSSIAKPSMILMNALFAKDDLASQVLQMCPHRWQDQFNFLKKSMTPMDMRSLLLSATAASATATAPAATTAATAPAASTTVIFAPPTADFFIVVAKKW